MGRLRIATAVALTCVTGATALAAFAAGPTPGVLQGGVGVNVAGGARIVAARGPNHTTLVRRIRVRDGKTLKERSFRGTLGIPLVTYSANSVEGTWANGRRLVLSSSVYEAPAVSTFVTMDTRTLTPIRTIRLRGSFAYDALSPDGRRMYVLEFPDGIENGIRYVVRSLSLVTGKLDPGSIVDKTEPGEQMNGLPLARVWSGDRTWAYTLYRGATAHAFVHALDTGGRAARCLDLPWSGDAQNGLETVRMAIDESGILTLRQPNVGVLARIDTRSFAVEVVRAPVATTG